GKIWANGRLLTPRAANLTTFGQDASGELYLATGNGSFFRIAESGAPPPSTATPTATAPPPPPTATPLPPTPAATPTETPGRAIVLPVARVSSPRVVDRPPPS
ncbi:MAG: hypothetical protein LC796_16800, partial [Acidobacteria bacterium]|nr:hypothetical protein [Acidobacteriota bacterium]MCA1610084.1 hypothetical protein [Acidobacteriota bacterium]